MLAFRGVPPGYVPTVFLPYWFMYFLGVVVWWTLSDEVPVWWLWIAATASAVVAWQMDNRETWTAIATALVLYGVAAPA